MIFGLAHGVLDDLDFWSGTFGLVVFATIEAIIFGWFFGIDRAWIEIHHGADIQLPWIFRIVIKYITPTFLLILLGTWTYQQAIPVLKMEDVSAENFLWVLGTRLVLLLIIAAVIVLVYRAWRGRRFPDIDYERHEELKK